jgi:hypothetical protein
MNDMDELDLKKIWQGYDKKIDKILQINKLQLSAIQTEKAESKIRSFKRNHLAVMLFGIVWILFLGFILYHAHSSIFFTVSVGMIILFNIFAVALYLRHIIMLNQIDIAGSITDTQTKLIQVQTSYSQVGRVLLLQTPFYCTWWYTEELVRNGGFLFWAINLSVVAILTTLSVYLFSKLSDKNKSEHWVKRVDKWFGAEKLQQASSFLQEIENYKKDE